MGSFGNPSPSSKKQQQREWFAVSFKPENFIPGLVIGFILGMFLDLSKPTKRSSSNTTTSTNTSNRLLGKHQQQRMAALDSYEELKMVLVVRQDLKMGPGKIASQCAHAATGLYSELVHSQRSLLRQWELCGQPKIVVTCKNQQEMNKLKEAAESIGLPTFVVADAGRTQVSAGSKTVLAVGPGHPSSHSTISTAPSGSSKPTGFLPSKSATSSIAMATFKDHASSKNSWQATSSNLLPSSTPQVESTGSKASVDSVTGKQRLL